MENNQEIFDEEYLKYADAAVQKAIEACNNSILGRKKKSRLVT